MTDLYNDKNIVDMFNKHEKKIQGMLNTLDPEALRDEKQVKKTLKLLAILGNVNVKQKHIDQLAEDFIRYNFDQKDPSSLKKFIKTMQSKKRLGF